MASAMLWVKGLAPIFISLIFGAVTITFILIYMRSHRLRLRDPLNNKAYINDLWIKEVKDKDSGVLYWQSVWGKKALNTPAPPTEAVEVGKRGRKYAEAYRVSEDEFIWINDKGVKFKVDENGKKKIIKNGEELEGFKTLSDNFKPFSAVQREILVTQYRKAAEIRAKRWSADKVVAITSIMGLVLLCICLMIFWGDLAAPILAMQGNLEDREIRLAQLEKEICTIANGQTTQTGQPVQNNVIIQQDETPPERETIKDIYG